MVCLLHEQFHGNSAIQLYNKVREQHSELWVRITVLSVLYLTAYELFTSSNLSILPTFPQPPPEPSLLKPQWFMSIYVHNVLHHLDDVMAKITSVFGNILKMD